MRFVAMLISLWLLAPLSNARAQAVEPLPIEAFTQRPAIWSATLSPDGRYVAAIQESSLGPALTIIDWRTRVAQVTQLARRDRHLTLDWVAWKNDDRVIFALRQEPISRIGPSSTPETTRIYASNRDGSDLTLMFGGEMRRRVSGYAPVALLDLLHDDPDHILLATYAQRGYTIYRADVASGSASAIVDYAGWNTAAMFVDGNGYPVMRVDQLADNSGWQLFRRSPTQRDWTLAHEIRQSTVSQNRFFAPLGPGPGPGQVYVAARSEDEEFQAIYLYNTATGGLGAPVYRHDGADAAVAWLDPNDNSIVVGCGEARRWRCRALQPEMQRHLDGLVAHFRDEADIALQDVSADERYWLVSAHGPRSPASYYVYDLSTAEVSFVASSQPHLQAEALAPMQVIDYSSRDGAALWGYLTTPPGGGAHPLVVMPHGGPESRDSFSYDFYVQFLASRGYAVFQPNFRGSEGSGRSFAIAGRRQWGRRMQDDVTDGVRHLVNVGLVDRDRMCIVGASYGGYAALAAVTLTPDLFRCAISVAGVSDLIALLNTERREEGRRSTSYAYWLSLIGDPRANEEELVAVSPAQQAANAGAPVLLIHGEEDYVVRIDQSERARDALIAAGKPVELIRIEDEGHSWSDWEIENRQRLLAETERFLRQHIGASR